MRFLKLFWKEIGVAIILFLFAITLGVTRHQLKTCKADGVAKDYQIKVLSNSINLQNSMIDSLAAKAKESEKRYLGAIKKAKVIVEQGEVKISQVEKIKIDTSTCESQLDSITEILKTAR